MEIVPTGVGKAQKISKVGELHMGFHCGKRATKSRALWKE